MLRAVVCISGLGLAAGVAAQAPTGAAADIADSPPSVRAVGDEVVVRGQRMSEIKSDLRVEVDKFVTQVASPVSERGYARWHRGVCVSIQNLERNAAQYLVDRISRLAADVGLEPGEPGCEPVSASNSRRTVSKRPAAWSTSSRVCSGRRQRAGCNRASRPCASSRSRTSPFAGGP